MTEKFVKVSTSPVSCHSRGAGNPKVLSAVLLLLLVAPSFLHAQAAPLSERQKIEALIQRVAELKDAKFVRNGIIYNPDTAATFLRRKWQANESKVKSARDFIEKVASFSGTSGKPYLIRLTDGTEVATREYLSAELRRLDTQAENQTGGAHPDQIALFECLLKAICH